MTSILNKAAMFGDIHHGRRNNLTSHNIDCKNYIEWLCDNITADKQIDHVVFLGDWHENRSALNISTLNYSYKNAETLNKLGLPIYHIIGNHDLYHRHTREVHSIIHFNNFKNYTIVNDCIVLQNTKNKTLLAPFLFEEEYQTLSQYNDIPIWMGHFEFKNFIVSGHSFRMPTGPEIEDYTAPKHIFSGHFHKRQHEKNVDYIGNAFPMDFSDSNDFDRGFATYNHEEDLIDFINWEQCPKYIKTTLTDLIAVTDTSIYKDAKIKCLMDQNLTYEEVLAVKQTVETEFDIRELILEEPSLINTLDSDESHDVTHEDINETITKMLSKVTLDNIDPDKLINIFQSIK